MEKKEIIKVSIDAELKKEAEKILENRGMPVEKAIAIFYKQIIRTNGVPFVHGLPYHMPKFLEDYTKEELEEEISRSYNNSIKKDAKHYTAEELMKELDEEFGFDTAKK